MNTNNLCPSGYSGLRPVPYDCTKFANCWKGRPVIQSCGPGTHFNARYSVCDWPGKANCKPEFPGITPRIFTTNDDDDDDNVIVVDEDDDSSNIGTDYMVD